MEGLSWLLKRALNGHAQRPCQPINRSLCLFSLSDADTLSFRPESMKLKWVNSVLLSIARKHYPSRKSLSTMKELV
jgi:hypothetical protein